jgi:hypothetical protein
VDTGTTTTQIRFLAKGSAASRQERFRPAIVSGLHYLLAAQYSNGGWPRGFDYELIADPTTSLLWARFHDFAANRPMYVGRDDVVKDRSKDVEYERRTGHTCLGPSAADLLNKDFPTWKKRLATKMKQPR